MSFSRVTGRDNEAWVHQWTEDSSEAEHFGVRGPGSEQRDRSCWLLTGALEMETTEGWPSSNIHRVRLLGGQVHRVQGESWGQLVKSS